MLQLFFFYFFFPLVLNIDIPAFPAAVLTFVLNYAAYFAEIYRGGILSIDRGQYEAAHSLGLSKAQTTFGIIIPQAMRVVLPPVSNEAITLVKDTSLARVIAVYEVQPDRLRRRSGDLPVLHVYSDPGAEPRGSALLHLHKKGELECLQFWK